MGKLILRALAIAGLTLALSASQATAVSSIDLVYLGGGGIGSTCAGGDGKGNCVQATDSDTIRLAITITIDSLGMSAYAFDLRFDEDGENELELVNFRHRFSLNLPIAGPAIRNFQTDPLSSTEESLGIQVVPGMDIPGSGGHLQGFDAITFPSGPMPTNLSFRVGIVEFHVNGNVNNGNAVTDIQIGYFRNSGPGFGDSVFNNITPNFGSFEIDPVPETGTSILMGMGVLGMILVARRRS